MLGISVTLTKAVFVYLYLHVRQIETLYSRSSYRYLFKNILNTFEYFEEKNCIRVFVYLHLCIWVLDNWEHCSWEKIVGDRRIRGDAAHGRVDFVNGTDFYAQPTPFHPWLIVTILVKLSFVVSCPISTLAARFFSFLLIAHKDTRFQWRNWRKIAKGTLFLIFTLNQLLPPPPSILDWSLPFLSN